MIGTWFDRRFGDVVCAFGATLRFWREVIAVGLARSRSSAEVQGEAFLAMQGDSVGRGGGNAVGYGAESSSGAASSGDPQDQPNPVFAALVACDHCGTERPVLEFAGQWVSGSRSSYLCHPNEGLDCYRLVTVYGEKVGFRKSNPDAPEVIPSKIPFDGLFPSGQPSVIPVSVCLYCFGPVDACSHSGEVVPDQPVGERIDPQIFLAQNDVYARIQDEHHEQFRNQKRPGGGAS